MKNVNNINEMSQKELKEFYLDKSNPIMKRMEAFNLIEVDESDAHRATRE